MEVSKLEIFNVWVNQHFKWPEQNKTRLHWPLQKSENDDGHAHEIRQYSLACTLENSRTAQQWVKGIFQQQLYPVVVHISHRPFKFCSSLGKQLTHYSQPLSRCFQAMILPLFVSWSYRNSLQVKCNEIKNGNICKNIGPKEDHFPFKSWSEHWNNPRLPHMEPLCHWSDNSRMFFKTLYPNNAEP